MYSETNFSLTSELIEYAESLPVTKRSVLKLSAKIFDPIGLLTPFTISMNILFQTLCVEKVNWDESLEGEALSKWKSFINDLSALKWKPARVEELLHGRDGQIRLAKVKVTSNEDRKPQVLLCVIQHLIPVEVSQ